MAVPTTYNNIPVIKNVQNDNPPWGFDQTHLITTIMQGSLVQNGDNFSLSTKDGDFGLLYGLKALYIKSKSTNIADAGVIRLSNSDAIGWRNNANSANLPLSVNSSDELLYNGAQVLTGAGPSSYVASITGTASQVIASGSTGAITLSLPQSIATSSDVQFGTLALGASLDSSSILSLSSTTKGFLLPRMTTTQRDAIISPATGLEIYNITTNLTNFYNGSSWVAAGTAGVSSITGTANQIVASASTGPVTLSLPADVSISGGYTASGTNPYILIDRTSPSGSIFEAFDASGNGTQVVWVGHSVASGITTIQTDNAGGTGAMSLRIQGPNVGFGSTMNGSFTPASPIDVKDGDINVRSGNVNVLNQKELRLGELTSNGANYIGLKAPASLSGDLTYTLPSADGTSGYILSTNGSGTLSWIPAATGSGTVSSGTQYQLGYYAANGTTVSGLTLITASRALASDSNGLPVAVTTTSTELGYVNGVTSAIQTQINTKAPSASPTFSGTITTPLTASRVVKTGASSELTIGAVNLASSSEVSGNLPVTNLDSGTNASSSTFFRGDGVWASPVNAVIAASASLTMTENTVYISDGGAKVVFTLPSSCAVGSFFKIVGSNAPGWRIAQGATQTIMWSATSNTTSGTGGYLEWNDRYDCVEVMCIGANNLFVVVNSKGNITVV